MGECWTASFRRLQKLRRDAIVLRVEEQGFLLDVRNQADIEIIYEEESGRERACLALQCLSPLADVPPSLAGPLGVLAVEKGCAFNYDAASRTACFIDFAERGNVFVGCSLHFVAELKEDPTELVTQALEVLLDVTLITCREDGGPCRVFALAKGDCDVNTVVYLSLFTSEEKQKSHRVDRRTNKLCLRTCLSYIPREADPNPLFGFCTDEATVIVCSSNLHGWVFDCVKEYVSSQSAAGVKMQRGPSDTVLFSSGNFNGAGPFSESHPDHSLVQLSYFLVQRNLSDIVSLVQDIEGPFVTDSTMMIRRETTLAFIGDPARCNAQIDRRGDALVSIPPEEWVKRVQVASEKEKENIGKPREEDESVMDELFGELTLANKEDREKRAVVEEEKVHAAHEATLAQVAELRKTVETVLPALSSLRSKLYALNPTESQTYDGLSEACDDSIANIETTMPYLMDNLYCMERAVKQRHTIPDATHHIPQTPSAWHDLVVKGWKHGCNSSIWEDFRHDRQIPRIHRTHHNGHACEQHLGEKCLADMFFDGADVRHYAQWQMVCDTIAFEDGAVLAVCDTSHLLQFGLPSDPSTKNIIPFTCMWELDKHTRKAEAELKANAERALSEIKKRLEHCPFGSIALMDPAEEIRLFHESERFADDVLGRPPSTLTADDRILLSAKSLMERVLEIKKKAGKAEYFGGLVRLFSEDRELVGRAKALKISTAQTGMFFL